MTFSGKAKVKYATSALLAVHRVGGKRVLVKPSPPDPRVTFLFRSRRSDFTFTAKSAMDAIIVTNGIVKPAAMQAT